MATGKCVVCGTPVEAPPIDDMENAICLCGGIQCEGAYLLYLSKKSMRFEDYEIDTDFIERVYLEEESKGDVDPYLEEKFNQR